MKVIGFWLLLLIPAGLVEASAGELQETPTLQIFQGTPDSFSTDENINPVANAIDVQDAITMAVANDPGFQQISWAIEKAKGDRRQATRYPNPTMGIITNEIGNEGGGGQYGFFWSRNIVRNQRQCIQQRYFSIEIAALQQQYDIRRWQLSRTVGTRILKTASYEEQNRIIAQQMLALEDVLDITKKLFAAGEIANIAVSNIELVLDRLRQDRVELKLKREFELRALAIPLGIPQTSAQESTPPEIIFDWQETISELMQGDSTSLSDTWLETHPQINFANALAEQGKVEIQLAKAEQCPDLQVQAALNYDTYTGDAFGGFQIGVPIQKYDRKRGLIVAASAGYQRKREDVRLKRMQLQSMYTLNEGEIVRLRSRVNNLRDIIIPKADENLRQIRSAFEVGEAEYLLLRTGLQAVRDARLRLVETEYKLAVAAVDLQTLLLDP